MITKTGNYNTYKVTFTTQKKRPITRTVEVLAIDKFHASELVYNEFGTYTYNKQYRMRMPSDKRIKINSVKETKGV